MRSRSPWRMKWGENSPRRVPWERGQGTIPRPRFLHPRPANPFLVAIFHKSIKYTNLLFSYRYSVLDIWRSIDNLLSFNDKLMNFLRCLLLIYH